VAVEVDLERSSLGLAAATAAGTSVKVWTAVVDTDEAALALIRRWQPAQVLVGASLHERFAALLSYQVQVSKAGTAESRIAGPTLQAAVRDGRLAHDHNPAVAAQVAGAVAVITESGPLLTARRSTGPISGIKAVSWATSALLDSAPVELSAIY
jgi:hypothetical protein